MKSFLLLLMTTMDKTGVKEATQKDTKNGMHRKRKIIYSRLVLRVVSRIWLDKKQFMI